MTWGFGMGKWHTCKWHGDLRNFRDLAHGEKIFLECKPIFPCLLLRSSGWELQSPSLILSDYLQKFVVYWVRKNIEALFFDKNSYFGFMGLKSVKNGLKVVKMVKNATFHTIRTCFSIVPKTGPFYKCVSLHEIL